MVTVRRCALTRCKVFAFDMDGTLVLGSKPTRCSGELLDYLREAGKRFVVVTNNSSEPNDRHAERLSRTLGVEVKPEEVYSSLDHLGAYLRRRGLSERVFALLTRSSAAYLRERYGVSFDEERPRVVVVGFDRELTYAKLERACILIQKGVPWVLAHPDLRCPTEEGFVPDAGSIAKLIELTTGVKPAATLGKPSGEVLVEVAQRTGVDVGEVCYVGDRLYTDIEMALESGAVPVLVLSGETKLDDLSAFAARENVLVFSDLCELLRALREPCSAD